MAALPNDKIIKANPWPWLESLVIPAILGIAVLLRLWDLAARNLWTDEAWVALAALAPTPGEALILGRSTPPFYVLTIWGLVQVFGGSELVLRSLSFTFGVGVVVLFWQVSRHLTSRTTSLVGLALVAVSPVLVYFSKELKQYSSDAFFALLVVWLTERLRERPSQVRWLSLALVGPLALGFSHGAVFMLPVLLGVLWGGLPRLSRGRVVWWGSFWGLAVMVFYLLFYRHQVDPELVDYWVLDFPDFSSLGTFITWLGGALGRYFHYFFEYFFSTPWGWLWGLMFVVVGLVTLVWEGPRRLLFYWSGPLLLTFCAAALHRFPFMGHYNGSRLLLFSAPWFYLISAAGIVTLFTRFWQRSWRWLALALAALILLTLQPLALMRENLRPQANRQELQPLATYLKSHLLPGDWTYVYYHAIYPFKYYYRGNLARIIWGKSCGETNLELPASHSESPQRLWLVAAHFGELRHLKQFTVSLLGPHWRAESQVTRQNAALFLFVRQDQPAANSHNPSSESPQLGIAAPSAEKACSENLPPPQP